MQIPDKLLERLRKLGLNERIYQERARKCFLSKEDLSLEKVAWYPHAYYVSDTKDNFVFDPVSLVPCLALDVKKTDKILDMCAAPGTKTFILSFLTENEAYIVANDIDRLRIKRLKANVNKFHLSVEVKNFSGRRLEGRFDRILLDAPCSGEGMVNKKEKTFEHWSERRVRDMAKKQKKLINHAFSMLEPGGTLVYSTCTFSPEENELVVQNLLDQTGAKLEKIEIPGLNFARGLTEWKGKRLTTEDCIRIYPRHNGTGGFFVAKIRKI